MQTDADSKTNPLPNNYLSTTPSETIFVRIENNVIYIYDRYGKLITQVKPSSSGWNGTLKGNALPASDYWFVVNRQNGKRYTGHFTLKR